MSKGLHLLRECKQNKAANRNEQALLKKNFFTADFQGLNTNA